MIDKTIITLTDDTPIDPIVLAVCRKILKQNAGDLPIVCVSQSEKTEFATVNVQVGAIGRSWWSLYSQLLEGLRTATTTYICVAERDLLYPQEHLHWMPKKDDTFFHNENMWMLQWSDMPGHPDYNQVYSYRPHRHSLATMTCNRQYLLECIADRLEWLKKRHRSYKLATQDVYPAPRLSGYLKEHLEKYSKVEIFKTRIPVVDIRHGTNHSGPHRGNRRRYNLPPWGTIDDIRRISDA